MIQRYKHNGLAEQALGMLSGLAGIFDGLVTFLSFGFLYSNIEFDVVKHRAMYRYNQQQKLIKKVFGSPNRKNNNLSRSLGFNFIKGN